MTCAHRTRPMGSVVTVRYEGHSIQCRVNDRGPFIRGRVIDLSVTAARALGMMRSGVIHVSLELQAAANEASTTITSVDRITRWRMAK